MGDLTLPGMDGPKKGSLVRPNSLPFICLSFLSVLLLSTSHVSGQQAAMVGIRQAFNSSLVELWKGEDPCSWKGVVCAGGVVTELYLTATKLVGQLPPELFTLSNLTWLDLSFNPGLTGPIPSALGNLTKLTVLNVEVCSLTGPIPDSLSNLSQLYHFSVRNNQLTGPLPANLSGLRSLTWFDISENNINGRIPDSIGSIAGLEHMHFYNNSLEGQIPASVANLTKLLHMILDWNKLNGTLPDLSEMPALRIINVDQNKFTGGIPGSYFSLPKLLQLSAVNCSLTGDVTIFAGSLGSIVLLDLSHNPELKGGFPTTITTALTSLLLDGNPLATQRNWIDVETNLEMIPNLQELHMQGCELTGDITSLRRRELNFVDLRDNSLEGKPWELFNVDVVNTRTFLGGNPAICGPGATVLTTTTEKAACSSAGTVAAVANNELCSLKSCYAKGGWPNFALINAKLDTGCPCARPLVVILRFDNPPFAPIDFPDHNRPAMLSELLANMFSLDPNQVYIRPNNYTAGPDLWVWTYWFPLTNATSLDNALVDNILHELPTKGGNLNTSLGIFVVDGRTLPQDFLPEVTQLVNNSLSVGAWVGIGVAIAVLVTALVLIGIYAYLQKKRADAAVKQKHSIMMTGVSYGQGYTATSDGPRLQGARLFTLQELKDITNNFSEDNVIGTGGYGSVYRGVLEDGSEVAIKRLDPNSHQGAQEFNSEVELLSRVHHRNLVNLVGFCNVDNEQALIYELMSNGMVKDWLLHRRSPPLTYKQRLEIALGSARGLQYLHHDCSPPIIHRDIKTANILLSDTFVAKVADFGLSKNVGPGEEESFVKGTLGYLDPEYFRSQLLTEKSDVYSFGVVLLELMTGMAAVSKVTKNHISRDVKSGLANDGASAVADMDMKGDYDESGLMRVLALGLRCLQEGEDYAFRPNMKTVVKELDSICTAAGITEDDLASDRGSSVASLFTRTASLFRRNPNADDSTTDFTITRSMTTGGTPSKPSTPSKSGGVPAANTEEDQSSSTAYFKAQQREQEQPIVAPDVDTSQTFAMTQRIATWWNPKNDEKH